MYILLQWCQSTPRDKEDKEGRREMRRKEQKNGNKKKQNKNYLVRKNLWVKITEIEEKNRIIDVEERKQLNH